MSQRNLIRPGAIAIVAALLCLSGLHAQLGAGGGPSYGEMNPQQMARMINPVEDGPFHMINLIQYRDKAVYPDGRATDLTGRQADNLYRPTDILQEIGAEVVFVADVKEMTLGDDVEWDRVAIVRYPSRASFLKMTQRADFRARSIHKDAGVGRSVVMVSRLVDAAGEAAPSSDPSTFEVVDVLRYRETARYEESASEQKRSGRQAMQMYAAESGAVAAPLGVRPTARFEIEGVLIGDGRAWDEVRIHHFPNQDAFEKHLNNPQRRQAQRHRTAALADNYGMRSQAFINRLAKR